MNDPRPMHLAFFHAPWCGVCHQKAPVVEQIASDARMDLTRWDIEQDDGRAEAERRRIRTVPTLALVHGDRVPFRLVGRMITPENVRHLLARFAHAPDAPWPSVANPAPFRSTRCSPIPSSLWKRGPSSI